MVNFLIKSCGRDPQITTEKVEEALVELEPETQPQEAVRKTWETLYFLGNVLKIAFVIVALCLAVVDMVAVTQCLLDPETNIKESFRNLSEQIKNHSMEKSFGSYVVNSIPWTTEYIIATEMVFLLYTWAISYTKRKPCFDIVNIFTGNLIVGLALSCANLHFLGVMYLLSLNLIEDLTIPAYIFVIYTSLCAGALLIRNVVCDLKKVQLGIHDPRTILKKVLDYFQDKTCEADQKLEEADADHIKGEIGCHVFFLCVVLMSGSHVFVQQKLRISEINEEIANFVEDLVKVDVEPYVRTFLWICDYLIIADFTFLVYLYFGKILFPDTKRFVTSVHIVSGTLILWMTHFCMLLEYILLVVYIVTLAFPQATCTDLIYLIFVEYCLHFCEYYISDFVKKFKETSKKQDVLNECT